jgi:hypothetical protein
MQRILNWAKQNKFTAAVIALLSLVIIFGSLRLLLLPAGPQTDFNRIDEQLAQQGFTQPERAYLFDRELALSDPSFFNEPDEVVGEEVNISLLRKSLPLTTTSYQIAIDNTGRITIRYRSTEALTGALGFLKQFGVSPNYPNLQLINY